MLSFPFTILCGMSNIQGISLNGEADIPIENFVFAVICLFVLYTMLFETVFVSFMLKTMKIEQSPCFYGIKILSGALKRLTVIG